MSISTKPSEASPLVPVVSLLHPECGGSELIFQKGRCVCELPLEHAEVERCLLTKMPDGTCAFPRRPADMGDINRIPYRRSGTTVSPPENHGLSFVVVESSVKPGQESEGTLGLRPELVGTSLS